MGRSRSLRIGTRASALALAQTSEVESLLRDAYPGLGLEVVPIRTGGDRNQSSPIAQIGGRGVFVREIERALSDGEIDIAVHSLKDLPSSLPPGLCIGGAPRRADPRDVLVLPRGGGSESALHGAADGSGEAVATVDLLPAGARIGTSSLRRAAQIRRHRPDLLPLPIRGKVETRLRKLDEGQFDAIVLAAAGLLRLDLGERIGEYLDPQRFVPSAGQGIIAIEIRRGDGEVRELVRSISDQESLAALSGEREFLSVIQGGCHTPVGCISGFTGSGEYELTGFVSDLTGGRVIRRTRRSAGKSCEAAGRACAEEILEAGGREILKAVEYEQ